MHCIIRHDFFDHQRDLQQRERRIVILDKLIFALLVLLLALTPLPYGTVEVWSITVWELWILVTTLLWGIHAVKEGKLSIAANPLVLPLLALLVVALAQFLPLTSIGDRRTLSYDAYSTLQAAIKLLALILFFLLFSTFVNTDERRSLVVKVIIGLAFIFALVGIGQVYIGKALWQRGTFGPFVNRNHFAGFLEMGIGLAVALIISKNVHRERLAIYGCIVLVLCGGVVISGSRGGVLSLMAEAVFLGLLAWPGKSESGQRRGRVLRGAATATVLFALTLAGAMLLVGSEKLVQNFAQLSSEAPSNPLEDEPLNRGDIWPATIQMIKDHPIIGVGLGAYQFAYTRYDPSSGRGRVEQAHNDYLQIVADAGLIGGLIALLFLTMLFIRGFAASQTRDQRRRAIVIGSLTGCFAIAVHSFVDFNLQVTSNAQLFLALASMATASSSERQTQKPRAEDE
jgi:O-antigen ligase